jgi:AcrR family transcriptional regulator
VGRPRRLTLEAIVDAACRVGFEQLEMCLVAERLNTGVATLYGYVRGRDHLLELVVDRMASLAMADDFGGTWQEVLRGHAALCFEMFKSRPEVIGSLIGGGTSDREVAYAVNITAMLEKRGLPAKDAADIYVETSQAVIGAAVMLVRRSFLSGAGIDSDGKPIALPVGLGDYRPTLDRIVRDYEKRLAEQ